MSYLLNAFPGQSVTVIFESLLTDGYRSDGYIASAGPADGYGVDGYYTLPVVERVLMPGSILAAGYPKKMTRVDHGLYSFTFTLLTGATAVGSYIVDVVYVNPATLAYATTFFQIVVSAPFGQYSVSTF